MGGSLEEGKEPVKGIIPQLCRARWKDRLIDADEPVVIPSKEGEIPESGFRMSDEASDLERAWLRRQGGCAEIVKDRATVPTENGKSGHQPGDTRSLMWCAERDKAHQWGRMLRHRVQGAHHESSEGMTHKGYRFTFRRRRHKIGESFRYLRKGEFSRGIPKDVNTGLRQELLQARLQQEHIVTGSKESVDQNRVRSDSHALVLMKRAAPRYAFATSADRSTGL